MTDWVSLVADNLYVRFRQRLTYWTHSDTAGIRKYSWTISNIEHIENACVLENAHGHQTVYNLLDKVID